MDLLFTSPKKDHKKKYGDLPDEFRWSGDVEQKEIYGMPDESTTRALNFEQAGELVKSFYSSAKMVDKFLVGFR